jgi:hypothetical protein
LKEGRHLTADDVKRERRRGGSFATSLLLFHSIRPSFEAKD